jgi:hypothetical protein
VYQSPGNGNQCQNYNLKSKLKIPMTSGSPNVSVTFGFYMGADINFSKEPFIFIGQLILGVQWNVTYNSSAQFVIAILGGAGLGVANYGGGFVPFGIILRFGDCHTLLDDKGGITVGLAFVTDLNKLFGSGSNSKSEANQKYEPIPDDEPPKNFTIVDEDDQEAEARFFNEDNPLTNIYFDGKTKYTTENELQTIGQSNSDIIDFSEADTETVDFQSADYQSAEIATSFEGAAVQSAETVASFQVIFNVCFTFIIEHGKLSQNSAYPIFYFGLNYAVQTNPALISGYLTAGYTWKIDLTKDTNNKTIKNFDHISPVKDGINNLRGDTLPQKCYDAPSETDTDVDASVDGSPPPTVAPVTEAPFKWYPTPVPHMDIDISFYGNCHYVITESSSSSSSSISSITGIESSSSNSSSSSFTKPNFYAITADGYAGPDTEGTNGSANIYFPSSNTFVDITLISGGGSSGQYGYSISFIALVKANT